MSNVLQNLHRQPAPAYMNEQLIRDKAGVPQPWGSGPTEDPEWRVLLFGAAYEDAVVAAIESYDIDRLNEAKAAKAKELGELRWSHTLVFKYDGVWTNADPAMSVVLGTLELRKRRGVPPEAEQTWKLSDNEFRKWSEPQIEAFGFGISDHLQPCFDNEERLSDLIHAATTLAEVADIDLNTGWPQYP